MDDSCGNNLKVSQKRRICRGADTDAEHKKDRGGNIQKDHTSRVGEILSREAFLLVFMGIMKQIHYPDPDTGPAPLIPSPKSPVPVQ